jgi:iron complex transport system ATP-binding protein
MMPHPVSSSRVVAPVALRTRDLAIGYQTRWTRHSLIERINLVVEGGELVGLLGANGIGKSTLLRTLARMQPALRGTIELGGADLRSVTPAQLARCLGVVLTERVAIDALPARRIVELGRYPHSGWFGRLNDGDHRVVDWAIDAVGMRHLAERDFSRLSDGERQRVMIARALAQEPVLLILDEPTAFLDLPSRVELMSLLRQLTRDGGLAVVLSTHDLELALRTADAIWLMMPDGDLVTGAPEDVIVSGGIARAFEGRHIRFHDEERSFRWQGSNRGKATVNGTGLQAAMAKAVLEREGYAIVAEGTWNGALSVETGATGWVARADDGKWGGADFASLATFLRKGISST